MATDKKTLDHLRVLVRKLEALGVKSPELRTLKFHIGQQSKQIGWELRNGKWVYRKSNKR